MDDFEPPFDADAPGDRTLPHDLDAEQAYLAALMLTPPRDQRRTHQLLAPGDFYRPAHTTIHTAAGTLLDQAAPVDLITLTAELQRTGELTRVGGPLYLGQLGVALRGGVASSAPTYADRIRALAQRRALIETASRIAARGYDPAIEPADAAEEAVTLAREVRDAGRAADDQPVLDMWDFLAIEETHDWIVPGLLERMDRMILTGGEGGGKALALDTPVPTPKGWTTMGALTVGQEIFAPDGAITRVVAATPTMIDRPCYRLTFSDGAQITADAEHLWLTETIAARESAAAQSRRTETKLRGTDQRHKLRHHPAVVTTEHIAQTLRARKGHALNHSIAVAAPLQYPPQELAVDPYLLGAWLGDGTSRSAQITCHPDDAEILDNIRAAGTPVRKLTAKYLWALGDGTGKRGTTTLVGTLRSMGVLNNKHIPEAYQRASVEQRLALLQGLMDTDGTVSADGASSGRGVGMAKCEFSVTNERLARGFHELALGLGIKAAFRQGPAKLDGRLIGTRYRVSFQSDLPVFRLARKAARLGPLRTRRAKLRYIQSVDPIPSVPVRCIQVDRPDGMFVAGRECIPTHNSVLMRQLAVCLAAGLHPFHHDPNPAGPAKVLVLDCENSEAQSRRAYRPLMNTAAAARMPVKRGQLAIDCRPEGVDLTRADGRAWLMRRVESVMPDVLVIGPIYQLHTGDPASEEHARKVTVALTEARTTARCALLMEAHAPHATGYGPRALRPAGSSLWMRWPEFGYGIRPVEDERSADEDRARRLVPWRGARDERQWPQFLRQGHGHGAWPWITYQPIDWDPITTRSATGATS
jgi:hypothetical protein